MSICAFVPRVFTSLGPHATLQIVLSAVVTSELMLSSQGCEPRSSHRTFLPVLLPRPRQPDATRAQRAAARAVSFAGPLPSWRSLELAAGYWGSRHLWHQGHNARRPIANLRPRFGAGFFLRSLLAQLRSQHPLQGRRRNEARWHQRSRKAPCTRWADGLTHFTTCPRISPPRFALV
jgi:hypothetical protein